MAKDISTTSGKIGAILGGMNGAEFDDIRAQLRKRKVVWYERKLHVDTVVFWFLPSELSKLPTDKKGPTFPQYLPVDDDSGHTISPVDHYLKENPGTDEECK